VLHKFTTYLKVDSEVLSLSSRCKWVVKIKPLALASVLTAESLGDIKGIFSFSETETGFGLVSMVLCILLCETKTSF